MLLYLVALLPVVAFARQPDHFVVGGSDADNGAWPWQLSLQYLGSHSCGASLIGATKAVTAAHCAGNAAVSYTIIAGINQLSCNETTCESYQSRRVTAATQHPDFVNSGSTGYPNDIATVSWANPLLPVVGKIQYVTLATSADHVGRTCYITGWGRTSANSALPDNLQQALVDILTTKQCQDLWSAAQVSDNHVCVYDNSTQARGACNGDSGGPLVCQTNLNRWELVGATSWGRTGCSTAYPSVYTRISSYVTWINEN